MTRFLSILILFFLFCSTALSFDPADIPGLKLRYDINALATNDGTVITTLIDTSGNGYNATAAGNGTEWVNNLTELNNMGYLMFRNGTHYVATNPTLSQPNTVFMVARVQLPPGNWYYLMSGGNDVEQVPPAFIGMSAGNDCTSCPITGTNWVIYEFQFNGASSLLKTNGVTAWSGCNVGSASQGGTIVGARDDGGNEGNFDLAYLLFYNAALSADQSSNVVSWLNNKCHVYGYPPVPPAGPPWYASPTGKDMSDADGSITNPWDIYTAFQATNSIKPGDTLYLRGGVYYGGYLSQYASRLNLALVGTSNSPVTVRPYGNEKPVIEIGLADQTGEILEINGQYTILRDVEIMNPSTNRWSWGPYAVGVSIYGGPGNAFINCAVHDTGEGFWVGAAATNATIYGCYIYNNGEQNLSTTNQDGSPHTPDSRGHGHGIYARSPIPTTLFAENIIFNQFDIGLQCYTTARSVPLNGFRIEGNVCFGNGRLSSSGDWSPQLVVGGGGFADNLLIYTNFSIGSQSGANNTEFGSGAFAGDINTNGNGSIVLSGNHFIGDYNFMECFSNVVFTDNYVQGNVTIGWLIFDIPYTGYSNVPPGSSYNWDHNTYNLSWTAPFQLSTNRYHCEFFATNMYATDYPGWTNLTGFDVHSSYSKQLPTNVEVYVRPNKYDTNRANIIVINWPTNNTVNVDLSSVLKAGDQYQILNGQDPLSGPILTGTYSDAVTLPMTNLSVATPIGATAPPALSPFFGVFIAQRVANQGTVYGDVDGDGEITAYDAALTARHAVGYTDADFKNAAAADVDGDGNITAYDAALIAQRAVGLISKFPVEP